MSKSIGDQAWAEMTEGQKVEAVFAGRATLKQMSEGLLDGSAQLRTVCWEYLAENSSSFENLPADQTLPHQPVQSLNDKSNLTPAASLPRRITKTRVPHETLRQRFGLPEGFVPRLQRYGRSVLLELNIYRLPNGQEFIPCRPSGTLGASRHLYALQTEEQYLKGKRGSVYVRTDGKIFDYSVDTMIPIGDIFDTGYTIADLERTGRYAPELGLRHKRTQQSGKKSQVKTRQAAAG